MKTHKTEKPLPKFSIDLSQPFLYENQFYLGAGVERLSKFAAQMELYRKTLTVPGDLVECGVYKGASLMRFIKFRAIVENAKSRKIIGCDTFGDFPQAQLKGDIDIRERFLSDGGSQSISQDLLLELLKQQGLNTNVQIVAGDVAKTLPDLLKKSPHLRISLLHVDVDMQEPTELCLKYLGPRVVPGGVIIFDDFNKWDGAGRAIDAYLSKKGWLIKRLPYCSAVSYVDVPVNK
ncbi:MAG: hypothetical protein A2V88_09235 [Elusimicrobia bacterium RBG_16_66_12]|nr:MAG: hypothetical protein A2V88_09235 [Elusimicrobia bacterium RBG_16_66_12]